MVFGCPTGDHSRQCVAVYPPVGRAGSQMEGGHGGLRGRRGKESQ